LFALNRMSASERTTAGAPHEGARYGSLARPSDHSHSLRSLGDLANLHALFSLADRCNGT
jgi:hypothetical protein